ncbi:hypothetical protein [Billgrantia montanilacus]|uniref:Phage tail tape measure protein n=1 Tax=Billgrantia montanilacus TaxID=2282305 RepID=A0A368U0X1_9GAMM|nr:hypothetical protein [Halomonas montanilacus]RCV89712.1 hypothetical protein DU505_08905 [Halomonas montanilacus]
MARDLNLSVTLSAINKATGPLRQILSGSQGAGRAMRETRAELRNLNDQQKRLQGFRDMSRQSHATRRALMDKREELRQISRQLESTSGPTRRLTQQQKNAQREVDKLSNEYRTQRNSVRELARELPAGTRGTKGFEEQNAALARQIEITNRRLERQQTALRRLGEADVSGRFRNMTGEARRFTRNLTIGATLAAGSIFGLANSTATLGDDVAKTADAIGIGTTELQELRYAAERAGVDTGTLDGSMQRFTRRVGLAAQGSGAAKKAYEELGLSAQDLARMSPDRALGVVADRLNEVEGHTNRAAFASQLFGNSGADLLNMLQDGGEGLSDYARQAHLAGGVLSEEAARGAEDFKDAMLDAQLGMNGMRHTIGAELMPAVADLMRELSAWMQENSDKVREFARAFGENLKAAVPVLKDIAQGAATVAGVLGDIIKRAADMVGGFDNLAIVLGGLFASKLILSVVMFGISLVKAGAALAMLAGTLPGLIGGIKALSLAFMATPLGWVIGAITAIAAGAIYLWRNWETIGPKFRALWEGIKERAGALWDWLKGLVAWSPMATFQTAWGAAGAWFGDLWGGIKAAFDGGIATISQVLIDWSPLGLLWRGISAGLSTLGVDVPRSFSEIGGFMVDGLLGGISAKWDSLKDTISDMAGSVTGWFKERLGINSPSTVFAGFGGNLMEGLVNGIDERWSVLRDKIGDTASAVRGWFADRLGINSPSRVFATLGDNTMQGYEQGLERSERGPLKEVSAFTRRLQQAGAGLALGAAASVAVAVAGSGGGGGVAIDHRPPMAAGGGGGLVIQGGINIEIHAAPGMDEQALARMVDARVQHALQAAERRMAARQRSALYDTD